MTSTSVAFSIWGLFVCVWFLSGAMSGLILFWINPNGKKTFSMLDLWESSLGGLLQTYDLYEFVKDFIFEAVDYFFGNVGDRLRNIVLFKK